MFFLRLSWFVDRFCVPLQQKSSSKRNMRMATSEPNKIEHLVLHAVYSSRLFEKLNDPKTGLYFQSSGYVYSFLEDELNS